MLNNKDNLLLDKISQRGERLKSMRLSLAEGSFAIIMIAMIEAFYVPYLNAMGAGTLEVGLAVSLPALAGAMIQIYGPAALKKAGSSKKLVVLTVLAQAIFFYSFCIYLADTQPMGCLGGNRILFTAVNRCQSQCGFMGRLDG